MIRVQRDRRWPGRLRRLAPLWHLSLRRPPGWGGDMQLKRALLAAFASLSRHRRARTW